MREALRSQASAVVLGPILGLWSLQTRVGPSFVLAQLLSFWGPSLAPPASVFPGWERGNPYLGTGGRLEGDQSRRQDHLGLNISAGVPLRDPASCACKPGRSRPGIGPRPRPPRLEAQNFAGTHFVLANAELGPALAASQARPKLGEAHLGLADRQNARPGLESQDSRRRRARGWRQSAGGGPCSHAEARLAANGRPAPSCLVVHLPCFCFCFFFLTFLRVWGRGRTLNVKGLLILRPATDKR